MRSSYTKLPLGGRHSLIDIGGTAISVPFLIIPADTIVRKTNANICTSKCLLDYFNQELSGLSMTKIYPES